MTDTRDDVKRALAGQGLALLLIALVYDSASS
jgi:hypothetical protein